MTQNHNDQVRSILSDETLSMLLTTTEGEALCVLMLGFDGSGAQDAFRDETGFDPTPELTTYLDVQISIAIAKLIDAGKKHFFVVLKDGVTASMAHCCARIRDDASDPRKPVLWVVAGTDKLSSCTASEEKAMREADRVIAIREFNEERITDELVCGCGAILSVYAHPENVPTLEGAAMADMELINLNPAEILKAYHEQKQRGDNPAPR